MGNFWHDWLYTPLLNVLMFLYGGLAFGSLGVAIVELTVILRLALLPFTVLDERNRFRFEKLNRKFEAIARDFRNDPIRQKELVRDLLKQHKVNYWSKVVVLGVQVLVLVLLYQVFMGGIRFQSAAELYSWVKPPVTVDRMFLGFDLGQAHDATWPAIVAVVLFAEIYVEQKQRVHLVRKSDVIYMIFFPIFTYVALWALPTVKSVFILSSMLFGMLVFGLRKAFFRDKKTA